MRIRTVLAAAIICVLVGASPALASSNQTSIMEAGTALLGSPSATLHTMRILGAREIRLVLPWDEIAPDASSRRAPAHFTASNPSSYPAANWSYWDTVIEDAHSDGIAVDLDIDGRAPSWAMPKSAPIIAQGSLDPSASDYQQFVEAVGKRYSGTYTPSGASSPLPKVTTWSVWNEPNYVSSLQPQGSGKNNVNPVSPELYRGLVQAAWKGLAASGHSHNTILIGELAPRGYPNDGHGYMFPVLFVRSLYCVGSNYKPLSGSTAKAQGCPTTASGRRAFARNNPGLFDASGISAHLYTNYGAPDGEYFRTCVHSGLCASLGDVGDLTGALDRSLRAYGSHRRYDIYDTEYGYQTSPPRKAGSSGVVSTATAATYLNWAEYISWKNPRIASYDQYQLNDPIEPTKANDYGNDGNYASGLETWDGKPKPAYYAFRLPLYLPKTKGHRLEVWGDIRPAPFAAMDTGSKQTAEIQFEAKGSNTFKTMATLSITNSEGYFDTHVTFPGSGTVRLTYTYPASDLLMAPGYAVYSRHVTITG